MILKSFGRYTKLHGFQNKWLNKKPHIVKKFTSFPITNPFPPDPIRPDEVDENGISMVPKIINPRYKFKLWDPIARKYKF